eukprot:NODE_442_length_7350_cov_0.498552.p1 type:complete len:391 gc:universal NODE_442_length_7350_cov_0.498552:3582-4754(+)
MNLLKKDKFSRAMASGKRRISKIKLDLGSLQSVNYKKDRIEEYNNDLVSLDRWKEDLEEPPVEMTENLTGLTYYFDENSYFFVFLPHKNHSDEIIVFKLSNHHMFVGQMNMSFVEKWKNSKVVQRSSSFTEFENLKLKTTKRSQSLVMTRSNARNMGDLFYSLKYDRVGYIKNSKIIDMTKENDTLNSFLLTNRNYIFYLQALSGYSKRKFNNLIYFYSNSSFRKINRFVLEKQDQQPTSVSKIVEKHKEKLQKYTHQFGKIAYNVSLCEDEIIKLKNTLAKFSKYEDYLSQKTLDSIEQLKSEFAPTFESQDQSYSQMRSTLTNIDNFISQIRTEVDGKMKEALTRLSGFRSNLISINEKQDKYRRRAMLVSFVVGGLCCFVSLFWIFK